jgi:DnaK suppressor protein
VEKNMLNDEEKTYFREVLEQNLERLLSDDGKREPLEDYFKDENADPLDRASVESHASISFRFRERDSNLIRKIREAMERLDDDTFGLCDACGKQISTKRLKVRPVATRCITCKERQEKRERLFGT